MHRSRLKSDSDAFLYIDVKKFVLVTLLQLPMALCSVAQQLFDGSQALDFSHVNIHEVESVTIYKDGGSEFGLRGFAGAINVKLRSL